MQEKDFPQTYARMSDDELARIDSDRKSLVPEAIAALDAELGWRGWRSGEMGPVEVEETAQDAVAAVAIKVGVSGALRLGIFFGCGIVAGVALAMIAGPYADNEGKFAELYSIQAAGYR